MSDTTMEITNQEISSSPELEQKPYYPTYSPRVDIYESDNTVVLLANMPGVDTPSLDITLEKNVLSIKGTVYDYRPDGYERSYAEYRAGHFERSFSLSEAIDRSKIEATLKHGVLRLTLPKNENAKTRKIAVNIEQ